MNLAVLTNFAALDLQFAVGLKSAEIEILNHKSEEFGRHLRICEWNPSSNPSALSYL